jgi:uncharacterized protein with HEPN domain
MVKGDLERIRHIRQYCLDIAKTVKRADNSLEVFSEDTDFYNSISMSIMQIGELSGGLSDEFKDATRNEMPWGMIRGMRNHFAHGYATMEKSEIWETATKDIPNLLSFCERIIAKNTQ